MLPDTCARCGLPGYWRLRLRIGAVLLGHVSVFVVGLLVGRFL